MNIDKKSESAADTKKANNSSPDMKGKARGKPEKDVSDQSDEEGAGDKKDAKNGAGKKDEGPMALGEISFIDSKITSTKIEGLQPLYSICFDAVGKTQTLKKNLRAFKGFSFKEDSTEYKDKVESVQKLDIKVLKALCDILDLDKKGANKEIGERICQFLLSPEGEMEPSEEEDGEEEEEDDEEEEEAPKKGKRGAQNANSGGRPRRSTAGRGGFNADYLSDSEESEEEVKKPKGKRKRGDTDSGSDYNPSLASDSDTGRKRQPRAAGTRRSARYQSNSEDEDDEDFMSSEEESDEPKKKSRVPAKRGPPARGRKKKQSESEEESEPEESDESDAPKKKKAVQKGRPKAASASPAKGRGRPKRAAATTKKSARDQTTSEEEEEDDEELDHLKDKDVSEDEPLAKKTKSGSFPSDDEIKDYVKKILDEANLEEITMKTVCKEVYAQFPDHDLTTKKEFIKTTVKSFIAT